MAKWVVGELLCLSVVALCTLPGQGESGVSSVTASNWSDVLEGEWMVLFYAPWCPACQQIQSEWESFGKKSHVLGVNVAKVDVTQDPGLSGRFFVTTLPTIFHAKNGVFRRYHGSRMVEDLQTFISDKKWEVIEPVAGWKSPSSIMMSGMAGLFQLSGWMRQIHNYFTGPLGIPAWGSYIIFILLTLLVGLLLGLILVLLADCFCPAKTKYEVVRHVSEENGKKSEEDLKVIPKEEESRNISEDDKENGSGDSDVGGSEDSNEENADVSENEENDMESNAKDSDEDSAVADSEDEDSDSVTSMELPAAEPESALRQRRSEPVVDEGH
ncbi:hypothetical protein GDO86_009020 [Hymenochirus boettgeri]|uniref:Thioredoxin domain-containing protein n=1 Tax=Hymenochirus boettgeri TaxID=247094 RepID=A0A8T2JJ37_9PIPI|nr:hypothetical protein GDO86_009020 [Hymenochirus boettgeri]